MATAGMMNEAYFTGRKEIVAWIQGKYQPNLQRVEDLCTGAVYCQIIDSIYPNSVQLSKVKFQAKTETEFIHNFKVLQAAFVKNKLDRCALAHAGCACWCLPGAKVLTLAYLREQLEG